MDPPALHAEAVVEKVFVRCRGHFGRHFIQQCQAEIPASETVHLYFGTSSTAADITLRGEDLPAGFRTPEGNGFIPLLAVRGFSHSDG
jgi:hypothetical protein